ncbi:hypothetical protein [Candidatus Frankia alpina]|uniref:hypothetical protein n=1 Tax=Candidatus Frankia alpina TaxID=2699483 RepID=UPI0013CF5045|nr:hypothetical protein [Candidatus Frankia alpina]
MLRVRWSTSGLLLAGSLLLPLAACSSPSVANYDARMAYLRATAARGVETHRLLASQGAKIDPKRCQAAYDGLARNDIPTDAKESGTDSTIVTDAWASQVNAFFVDSCVSGLPRPVPGDPTPPRSSAGTPAASRTPAPDPSPTPSLTLHPAPTGTPAPRGS